MNNFFGIDSYFFTLPYFNNKKNSFRIELLLLFQWNSVSMGNVIKVSFISKQNFINNFWFLRVLQPRWTSERSKTILNKLRAEQTKSPQLNKKEIGKLFNYTVAMNMCVWYAKAYNFVSFFYVCDRWGKAGKANPQRIRENTEFGFQMNSFLTNVAVIIIFCD